VLRRHWLEKEKKKKIALTMLARAVRRASCMAGVGR